tara:strand:+ start:296 stop:478 length:183 start_codon:yes stop_codon:yes gene_type:complete
VGEITLSVERGGTTGPSRRDRLSVRVVDQVATSEHAWGRGAGGSGLNEYIALRVKINLPW